MRASRLPFLSLALLITMTCLGAQRQFVRDGLQHLPAQDGPSNRVAMGDLDGDGDLDVVLGRWGALPLKIWRNDGRGAFTDVTSTALPPRFLTYAADIALADLNGDGFLDLVVANTYAAAVILRNDGTGRFTILAYGPKDTRSMTLGDVDGDKDIDLVFGGNLIAYDRLWLNDGKANFKDATSTHLPATDPRYTTVQMRLVDVDGDKDLDLLMNDSGIRIALYQNDGRGHFGDVTPSSLIVKTASAIAATDVDGDGDMDIVAGSVAKRGLLYINDGKGNFTDASTRMPLDGERASGVLAADLDRDGDSDLVMTGTTNRLYENDGKGNYKIASSARLPGWDGLHAGAGDVDGNGTVDLVISGGRTELWLNDGSASFVNSEAHSTPNVWEDDAVAPIVGDFDGDGDVDIVIARGRPFAFQASPDRLLLGDGWGQFAKAPPSQFAPLPTASTGGVAVDVDRDGDLDLVVSNGPHAFPLFQGGQNELYLNDGKGKLTPATLGRMPVDDQFSTAVAAGDVNGDGNPDLVFANWDGTPKSAQNRLYLGDGKGGFKDAPFPKDFDGSRDVALLDIDGDKDLDVLFANEKLSRLYLNTGAGRFTDVTLLQLKGSMGALALATGDVDGDGDVDIVLGTAAGRADRLYINDGKGGFTDFTTSQMPGTNTQAVTDAHLDDVDGDGDLDLLLAMQGTPTSQHQLWLNDGRGRFSDATAARWSPDTTQASAMAIADVDLDGDRDLLMATGQIDVYHNRRRHLEAPLHLRLSQPFDLLLWGKAGYATKPQVGILVLHLAPQLPAVRLAPYGLWRVQLAGSLFMPSVLMSAPAGFGRIPLKFPQLPALVGQTLYSQALIFDSAATSRSRFTNARRDRILP